MLKLDEDTKKYLELFYNPTFTEHEFVATILPLLYNNGVHEIDENELAKKLYYYYINNNYKELFQDIALTRGTIDHKVDIYDGLFREKYFSGCIFWDTMCGQPLNLRYDPNTDLSIYEQNLSDDGKLKIRKMADELSIRIRLEQQSKNPLYIYGVNPNQTYTLVCDKRYSDISSFELITDGDISTIEYSKTEENENPMNPNSYGTLKDNTVAHVDLKNASFAIKQELCNDEIRYSIVDTEIIEPDSLKKVVDIANKRIANTGYLLNNQAPYVRKISLK